MTFADFKTKWKRRYSTDGVAVLPDMAKDFTVSAAGALSERVGYGTNVYDREWDVLVLLDACRHDMYVETVRDCPSLTSVGSASSEWLDKTFAPGEYAEEMARTAYITGNGYSVSHLDPDEFGLLDETFLYARDDELGTMPPGPLTDRAITVARSGDHDRIIVHYMQPHYPFIGGGPVSGTTLDFEQGFGLGDDIRGEKGIWKQARDGERDRGDVIQSYYANLEYVLPFVKRLRENVNGRVAVSADHGNGLGEWGLWGHRVGIPHPALKRVPWDVYECEDSGEYDPPTYDRKTRGDVDGLQDHVETHLAGLGYL